MVKYRDLTAKEREFITNGCGSKGGIVKVPNFMFKASCNQHDFYYWRGCTEKERLSADTKFYEKMLEDVTGVVWYKRWFYGAWAWTYYKAVRFGGKHAFYYADKQRTRLELMEEMLR